MADLTRTGVVPSLFDYVVEYAAEIDSGKESTTGPIASQSRLVIFLENFLVQFSSGYLSRRIEGFNDRSQAQLTAERRRLESVEGTGAAQRLIFHLEPLCSRLSEISYSNSEQDAEEFHLDYVPGLLDRILAWFEECAAEQALTTATSAAAATYRRSIESEPA